MAKLEKTGNYGEIAPSRVNWGSNVVYPQRLEGLTINTPDHSLRARRAMRYVNEVSNQGIVQDTFSCPIRNWDIVFINLDVGLLLEVHDKNNNIITSITLPTGKVSTFVWCQELRKGNFGYNSTVNTINGASIVFLGGINMPMCYLDDDLAIKNWLVLTNASDTTRYTTSIVEDFEIFQNRLSILVPNALATSTPLQKDLGIDTPWIYLSTDNSYDDFRQGSASTASIHIKPQNYEYQNYYCLKAFRNMLCVVHSGGLSVIKAGGSSGSAFLMEAVMAMRTAMESLFLTTKIVKEGGTAEQQEEALQLATSNVEYAEIATKKAIDQLRTEAESWASSRNADSLTQGNLLYYLADEAISLPLKALSFNNILMYLSVTGLRGRTLLEDPLTHKMEGFEIPTVCQRFTKRPLRFFKKPNVAQMCVFDGDSLFTFSERITTDKGGQLFARTTYLKSNDDLKILAINTSSAVLDIKGERFLVNDTDTDILGIGIINNFYATVNVLSYGTDWIQLAIDLGIEIVILLIDGTWYRMIKSGTDGRFLSVNLALPSTVPPTVQLIPLEGKGVMSLLPLAMRNEFYQWRFDLNGDSVIISGDSASIAVDTDPIVITNSQICAYSLPISIEITSTATQYGPTYVQELYIFCDRNVEAVATFNKVPKTMRYVTDQIPEYAFVMRFNPNDRTFSLKITATLGKTNELVIEQINFLTP